MHNNYPEQTEQLPDPRETFYEAMGRYYGVVGPSTDTPEHRLIGELIDYPNKERIDYTLKQHNDNLSPEGRFLLTMTANLIESDELLDRAWEDAFDRWGKSGQSKEEQELADQLVLRLDDPDLIDDVVEKQSDYLSPELKFLLKMSAAAKRRKHTKQRRQQTES